MSKTPSKSYYESQGYIFIPKEVTSPNKDSPGIVKTVFTHITQLQNFLNTWTDHQDKGTKICKTISALKLHECDINYFPHQLTPLTGSLVDILDTFENIVKGVKLLNEQLQALAKLQSNDEPLISTWSTQQISGCVGEISKSLQDEFRLKQIITENIAHCRDEKVIEVYVSLWEFETYFNSTLYSYLFAEVGLAGNKK